MRVRYPPEHYRSFYEWDQVPRTEKGWVKPLTLEAYVRITPDLQSGTLNHSYYALMAQYRKLPELVSGLVQPESLDRTAPDLVSRTLDEASPALGVVPAGIAHRRSAMFPGQPAAVPRTAL